MSVVTVVHNPASGGSVDLEELRAAIEQHAAGSRVRWAPTTPDDPGIGQARRAAADGCDLVLACGGDGTIRAVAEGIAGTRCHVGIVPLGTGNLLGANLGIEPGLDAIPRALSAPPTTLDTATINGERFAVMAGVGFDALMIRDADRSWKSRIGSAAYVAAAARNLPADLVGARVEVDGARVFDGEAAMVLVGNCADATGGLTLFPGARPDDGVVDVAVLSAEGLGDWAQVLWRLVQDRPQPDGLVRRARGKVVEIALDEPVGEQLDGEVREPTDRLRVEVDAASVEVRC